MHDPTPTFLAHADWGVHPRKRWRAQAHLDPDGRFKADGPDRVGTAGSPLERMGVPSGARALLGFDFPIGLPRAYAARARVDSFPALLRALGSGAWSGFFEVADAREEICLHRPFYPRSSGVKGQHRRQTLLDALGLESADLLRRCDRAHAGRRAAGPLFWTLGGQQVGKGALSGWREIVLPAVEEHDTALWPFEGRLDELTASRSVIAETYPAEFYAPLGIRFGTRDARGRSGKRRRTDRRAQAPALLAAAARLGIRVSPRLRASIEDGFGDASDGEDRFDAVVGLLGMLAVVLGEIPEGTPTDDPAVTTVEGWILGRPPV